MFGFFIIAVLLVWLIDMAAETITTALDQRRNRKAQES